MPVICDQAQLGECGKLARRANHAADAGKGVVKGLFIPGRAKRELRCAIAHRKIHNHDSEYGFRACAKRRIPE